MDIVVIGTGLMGYPIAEKLAQDDWNVIAWNRTESKAMLLEEVGARIAHSPREAIESAEVVILVLTDAPAITEVLFAGGTTDFANRTFIQMGTIAPQESREFHHKFISKDGDYFEAPVLGNKHHARDGELQIMIGGAEEQMNKWQTLLSSLGGLFYVGPIGSAAALKLALNHLIASLTASFSLSLELVRRNDVDVETFMDVLRDSALYSKQFDKKLSNMLEGDYSDPNFPTRHMLKDVNLAIDAAKSNQLETAAVEGVRKIIQNAIDQGFESNDYSSLFEGIKLDP